MSERGDGRGKGPKRRIVGVKGRTLIWGLRGLAQWFALA